MEQYAFERYILCDWKIKMMRDFKIINDSYNTIYFTMNIKTLVLIARRNHDFKVFNIHCKNIVIKQNILENSFGSFRVAINRLKLYARECLNLKRKLLIQVWFCIHAYVYKCIKSKNLTLWLKAEHASTNICLLVFH